MFKANLNACQNLATGNEKKTLTVKSGLNVFFDVWLKRYENKLNSRMRNLEVKKR